MASNNSTRSIYNLTKSHILNNQNIVYLLAILAFFNARRLVRSTAVFYVGGVLIGLLLSFLLLGYLVQQIIPIPTTITKIPFLIGGWPLFLYLYYWLLSNFGLIMRDYPFYVILYLCFFTLLSLAFCYRIGPPIDARTLNLAEWILQILSISAIYFLAQGRAQAIASIVVLLLFSLWRRFQGRIRYFVARTLNGLRNCVYGPQPRNLLTEDEYREESRIFTRMEMERLRQFCQSQDSRTTWRLIPRLRRPNRMSSFLTGDSEHVSMQEQMSHSELYGYEGEEEEEDISGYITDDDD